jgi:hypothetical protein
VITSHEGGLEGNLEEKEKLRLSILNRAKLKTKTIELRLLNRPIQFCLEEWYGRLGNNVQQILISIMHAESFRGAVEISASQLACQGLDLFFLPIFYDFAQGRPIAGEYRSNFFFFEGYAFQPGRQIRMHCVEGFLRLQSLLPAGYVNAHLHRVCRQYLRPALVGDGAVPAVISESASVVHLRGGDILNLQSSLYAVNPLCYYIFLRGFHGSVVLVAEPGPSHPLLPQIREIFAGCKIISGSIRDDFELLRQARFLASSGVGTFAVAAALLSDRLQRFYYSSAYLNEHLNPAMLDPSRVEVVEFKMRDYLDLWYQAENRHELLFNYAP